MPASLHERLMKLKTFPSDKSYFPLRVTRNIKLCTLKKHLMHLHILALFQEVKATNFRICVCMPHKHNKGYKRKFLPSFDKYEKAY